MKTIFMLPSVAANTFHVGNPTQLYVYLSQKWEKESEELYVFLVLIVVRIG